MPGQMKYRGAYRRKVSRPRGPGIPKDDSVGEATFIRDCRAYKLEPECEFKFALPRQWRFDFAWPDRKIAVEVEGGTEWGKSRHSKGDGFERDCEKYNTAARLGWIVLRYSTRMVTDATAIDEVLEVLSATAQKVR